VKLKKINKTTKHS